MFVAALIALEAETGQRNKDLCNFLLFIFEVVVGFEAETGQSQIVADTAVAVAVVVLQKGHLLHNLQEQTVAVAVAVAVAGNRYQIAHFQALAEIGRIEGQPAEEGLQEEDRLAEEDLASNLKVPSHDYRQPWRLRTIQRDPCSELSKFLQQQMTPRLHSGPCTPAKRAPLAVQRPEEEDEGEVLQEEQDRQTNSVAVADQTAAAGAAEAAGCTDQQASALEHHKKPVDPVAEWEHQALAAELDCRKFLLAEWERPDLEAKEAELDHHTDLPVVGLDWGLRTLDKDLVAEWERPDLEAKEAELDHHTDLPVVGLDWGLQTLDKDLVAEWERQDLEGQVLLVELVLEAAHEHHQRNQQDLRMGSDEELRHQEQECLLEQQQELRKDSAQRLPEVA